MACAKSWQTPRPLRIAASMGESTRVARGTYSECSKSLWFNSYTSMSGSSRRFISIWAAKAVLQFLSSLQNSAGWRFLKENAT